MNSTKEQKNAATRSQKKTQKATKKQQTKQPMPEKAPQNDNNSKALTKNGKSTSKGTSSTASNPPPPLNAHNNNNNNNNNIVKTNNNINQKLKESSVPGSGAPNVGQTPRQTLPGYENAPKFERSNSFSLRGKLSKLINSITGSKENLAKTEEEQTLPYKFTRSRSMILLRRSNRRSFIEPQLEQLSEEAEKSGDPLSPSSPRKNSIESNPVEPLNPPAVVNNDTVDASPVTRTPSQRQSMPPPASTPVEEHEVKLRRKPSTLSLAPSTADEGDGVPFNPIAHFQRRRSNTLLASFKNTIATLTSEKKKEKLNPKWSASLQSLQAIDNMVSYENMSFIDYDKFNGYEKQLERQMSTLSLMEPQSEEPANVSYTEAGGHGGTPVMVVSASALPTPPTSAVVMRRRKPSSVSRRSTRSSFNLDTNPEHNLDKPRNLYRDSLDSRKLERLNQYSRNSFILDKHSADWLNLEDGTVGKRRTVCAQRHSEGDVVTETGAGVQVSGES